jgi:hypothetical protein
VALAAAAIVAATPASAHDRDGTVYVAAGYVAATSHRADCRHPQYSSIQDAIEGVRLGGKVVVCPGTYAGSVTVDRRVRLVGYGATIDASDQAYGIGISAGYVTVRGFHVTNANDPNGPADGIITAGFGPAGPVAADHARIIDNVLTGNLGAGIDLNSTSWSVAWNNVSNENGIGVNVADDLGQPAAHNVIANNQTNRNFGGCGIALADHTGAGVTNNLVLHNVGNDNGLSTPTAPDASAGSGVILASPIPGGVVRDNKVIGNEFSGNGHGGVVVHAHAPGSDFSGNAVLFNRIGTNNLRTDSHDLEKTGIYLGSVDPLTIEVAGNVIGPDHYGVFTAGPVTLTGGHNAYRQVDVPLGHVDSY